MVVRDAAAGPDAGALRLGRKVAGDIAACKLRWTRPARGKPGASRMMTFKAWPDAAATPLTKTSFGVAPTLF